MIQFTQWLKIEQKEMRYWLGISHGKTIRENKGMIYTYLRTVVTFGVEERGWDLKRSTMKALQGHK